MVLTLIRTLKDLHASERRVSWPIGVRAPPAARQDRWDMSKLGKRNSEHVPTPKVTQIFRRRPQLATLQLFAHPFSSYCQKVLIALYENDTPFTFRMLGLGEDENGPIAELSPMQRMPLLIDKGHSVLRAAS